MFDDVKAIYKNDPAVKGIEFLLYPCLHELLMHRYFAHPMYNLGIPFVPRLVSQIIKFFTGVEIHPGVRTGKELFIDHAQGVVIGETAQIGRNCVLLRSI